MSQSFQYKGDLRRDSLAEMLFKIYRHRVPGVMEARRGDVVKEVYFKDGNVIYARSSDLNDSLGAYLSRTGLVAGHMLNEVVLARRQSNRRFGVLLMERRLLSPQQLNAAIRQQVEIIAWSLFSWAEGELTFEIRELDEPHSVRIHLPVRQMILRGIRQTDSEEFPAGRLPAKEALFEPCFQEEELIDLAVDRDEYALLTRIDGKTSVQEIAKGGRLSPVENTKLLYAFQVLQLIRPLKEAAPGEVTIRLPPEGGKTSGDP